MCKEFVSTPSNTELMAARIGKMIDEGVDIDRHELYKMIHHYLKVRDVQKQVDVESGGQK